jgi:hypothetical protein
MPNRAPGGAQHEREGCLERKRGRRRSATELSHKRYAIGYFAVYELGNPISVYKRAFFEDDGLVIAAQNEVLPRVAGLAEDITRHGWDLRGAASNSLKTIAGI